MRKHLLALFALFLLTPFLSAQSHSVVLSWTASTDTGGSVNVYRATVTCTTQPNSSFTVIKSGVAAAGPYTDATVAIGVVSYYITAVVNGIESTPSNCITVTVRPAAPTQFVAIPN